MAGKFLSPEEAARHLGVTVEDINRLVDRKKLFPMRDGATVKFKLDDIDRVAGDLADDDQPAASGGLDLELDLSSPGLGGGGTDDEILLGDAIEETESIFGSDIAVGGVSARTTSGDKAEPSGDDLVIGEGGGGLDSSDLEIDSIIGSSPALAQGASAPAGDSNVAGGSGTLAIDLSNLGSGPMAGGSVAGLSGSTPGAALSARSTAACPSRAPTCRPRASTWRGRASPWVARASISAARASARASMRSAEVSAAMRSSSATSPRTRKARRS